ncbi:MAG TPA: hypothetical protein PLV42_02065 [bacterium]|nr:hypothetical protein [bacterium]
MSGVAQVRGKRDAAVPVILEMRKVRAKLELFSPAVLLFAAFITVVSVFLTVDSYLKSYRNSQLVHISSSVDSMRFDNFKKTDLESQYLRLISAPALMSRARGLDLRPATKDRLLIN